MVTNTIKKWFSSACNWFTGISLGMLIFQTVFSATQFTVNATSFLLFFPFGICMAGAGMLRTIPSLTRTNARLLHFLITLVSFLFFILLPASIGREPPFSLSFHVFILLLLSVLYWIIVGLVHLVHGTLAEENTKKKVQKKKRK